MSCVKYVRLLYICFAHDTFWKVKMNSNSNTYDGHTGRIVGILPNILSLPVDGASTSDNHAVDIFDQDPHHVGIGAGFRIGIDGALDVEDNWLRRLAWPPHDHLSHHERFPGRD